MHSNKNRRAAPTFDDIERADKLKETLIALAEANKLVPIIVEGKRDEKALRSLGVGGVIITLHRGLSLYDFSEEIAEAYPRVILLLDWDFKGDSLYKELGSLLSGQWEELSGFRELLKILCQKDIYEVESIPILLKRLQGDEIPRH